MNRYQGIRMLFATILTISICYTFIVIVKNLMDVFTYEVLVLG